MHKAIPVLTILAFLILQACSSTPAVPLPHQSMPLSGARAVFVNVDTGTLEITGTSSATLDISGQVPSTDRNALRVTPSADGIHIVLKEPSRTFWQPAAPLQLRLQVPKGATLVVNAFDAIIALDRFDGKASITAVSGQITVRDSTGDFRITSNRGDVTIASSHGQLHVAGNYGTLSLLDSHGVLSAATIIGKIRFAGQVASADSVSLETDHGPIEIQLAQTSDVAVQVGTTSGVITCTVPGLYYTGQGCRGSLQSGRGQLQVRTVSGSVTLQLLP